MQMDPSPNAWPTDMLIVTVLIALGSLVVVGWICRRAAQARGAHPSRWLGAAAGLGAATTVFIVALTVEGGEWTPHTARFATAGVFLAAAAEVDARTYRVPDSFTAAAALIGLVDFSGLPVRLFAGGLLAMTLIAARQVALSMRGYEGFGLGDVKALCALGLLIGPAAFVVAYAGVVIAATTGLVLSRSDPFPFLPHVAIGALGLVIVFGLPEGSIWFANP